MNKYKVGDKVVFTVTGMFGDVEYQYYALNKDFSVWEKTIDKYSEPLSTYTEPLEAKIRRQAAEITRLLAENKELIEDKAVLNAKIDAYELCGDQHEVEYNQAFNQGAEEAWELAKKGMLMSSTDREAIFGSGCNAMYGVLVYHTYQEAAAKVAEWEKAKEEIKRGDIIRNKYSTSSKFCVTDIGCDGHLYGVGRYGLTYSNKNPEDWEKTGRHIDIDGFLKQIGGEK